MGRKFGISTEVRPGRIAPGWRWQAPVALGVFLAAACGDPSAPEAVIPQSGAIRVTVQTTGGDADADGYEVVVGTGLRRAIQANAESIFSEVSAGRHAVVLEGVAKNCEVRGSDFRSITVPAGGSVDVAFSIDCATTGIEVSVRTVAIGVASPSGYSVSVNGQNVGFIDANGSLIASRLSPGSHNLALTVAGNCNVADGPQRTVVVSNRLVTPVLIEVTCGPEPEPLPDSPASIFGFVVGGSGACIAGATVTVVAGQGVGQSVQQEMPCDAWAYGGGFQFTNLVPGVPMTIRASAGGYFDREMVVVPSINPQLAQLFVLTPNP